MQMATNFTQCKKDFLYYANHISSNYTWNGTVRGIENYDASVTKLITLEGCRALCHSGNQYYTWEDASGTISTWVLPIIGLLLQLPFESNAFFQTLYALARWMGSPIASLAYIFWNIKVTGKCALILDMATAFDDIPESIPVDEFSQFAQMRDSLFILSVMNQYSFNQYRRGEEAEKLLRVALFSDSLQLEATEDETRSLIKRRQKLAKMMREGRRKGIVPVFISLAWFLFSEIISLQAAFGHLGDEATAENLALGLLLAFIPVLTLSSIVDRNPVSSDAIRLKLNRFLDAVRGALLIPELRNTYIRDTNRRSDEFEWTMLLDNEDYFKKDFFTKFAGQARIRWHYGVAHPILAGIEDAHVAEHGRNWLENAEEARTSFVRGPKEASDLFWFDFREFWQILGAALIVVGSAGGAFIISYWTPTVGLGCRSGGYIIFVVNAMGLLIFEMISWWCVPSMVNRQRLEVFFFRPAELINAAWLTYIVAAQTFGSYNNCECKASTWGSRGGYLDFENYSYYRQHGAQYYWGAGTGISAFIMLVSFAFIVYSWVTQSFLTAEDYQKAMHGLRRTRQFKNWTSYIRQASDGIIRFTKSIFSTPSGHTRKSRHRVRRSVIWTRKANRSRVRKAPVFRHGLSKDTDEEEVGMYDEPSDRQLLPLNSPPESHSRSPSVGAGSIVSNMQRPMELHDYV